jgi:hypothetical protein
MLENKPKQYEFKNSIISYGISVALSIIIPSILIYFLDFKKSPKLVIGIGVLGLVSLIYYSRSLFDRKNKIVFDSKGIKIRNKLLKWEKVKGFEIKIMQMTEARSIHNLIIFLKKDNEVWVDISDLDLTEQKVKLIFSQFGTQKNSN